MSTDTSAIAYRTIQENGLLSKLQWEVYDILHHYGPLTMRELHDRHLKQYNDRSISPRFKELFESGCIEKLPKSYCTISGNLAYKWQVSGGLPRKAKKEKSKNEIIKQYRDALVMVWHHKDCTSEIRKDIRGFFSE